MNLDNLNIRRASSDDIDFIVEAIIEAEKSGTDKCGFANLFHLTEEEAKGYIRQMLEEEIDGCEFSIDSFLILEVEGKAAAAVGGWIEGENSSGLSSAMLKANLIGYTLPQEKILYASSKGGAAEGISLDRKEGALQIEYVFCQSEYRGHGFVKKLIERHISETDTAEVQVQVFGNNLAAVKVYESMGFAVTEEACSEDAETALMFPDRKKLLMTKRR